MAGRGHEPNHRARWVAAKSYSKPGLSISPARLAQANSSASPFLLGAADIWVVQLSCGGESGRGRLGDQWAVSVHPASDLHRSRCARRAGTVAHWSWVNGLLGGLVVGCALLRIFCEEVMVTARHPEYRQYAATTWRMIPYVF